VLKKISAPALQAALFFEVSSVGVMSPLIDTAVTILAVNVV
jgi:hypothetical protein